MKSQTLAHGKVKLYCGDCLVVIKTLADNSIDSIVTDPPYALVSIVKRFGGANAAAVKVAKNGTGAYARASKGFMGKTWDTGDTAFAVEFWSECLRVLKPGGHVVAFGGTRTYHRLACAIEDAGFEIRDQIGWAYGSGFPKSHNMGNGWGTALKPAWEPICLARKPLSEKTVAANVLKHGTGAINVDGCRIGVDGGTKRGQQMPYGPEGRADQGGRQNWRPGGEIITLDAGRWPANIIHDGSEEVVAAFPDALPSTQSVRAPNGKGSAARFFYTAKADANDRMKSKHPTVKPVDLMQYLVRLVTPLNGTVLDPFAGTGTTGEAAWREGFNAVLIEREVEYQKDIHKRLDNPRINLNLDEKQITVFSQKGIFE